MEIIISIAALSLISVFILQMFMSASSLNKRARDADKAMSIAITEIENFKKLTHLSDYVSENDAVKISELGGIITYYYDEEWGKLDIGGQNLGNVSEPDGAVYRMEIDISPDDKKPEDLGGLFSVKVDVTDISASKSGSMLTFLSSKKYFSNVMTPTAQ